MKEKLLCISFSACHPVAGRVLIISILIWIVCWSHSSILKCRLLPEEFITLLIQSDIAMHSDWCKESQAGVLAATTISNLWDTRSSSNRTEDGRQRCSWGAVMVTPVVPSYGTPPEKWNKLSVKSQTKGRFVVAVGFELAWFLGEDFRGSRTYSGSLWHTKYFWEIDKKRCIFALKTLVSF